MNKRLNSHGPVDFGDRWTASHKEPPLVGLLFAQHDCSWDSGFWVGLNVRISSLENTQNRISKHNRVSDNRFLEPLVATFIFQWAQAYCKWRQAVSHCFEPRMRDLGFDCQVGNESAQAVHIGLHQSHDLICLCYQTVPYCILTRRRHFVYFLLPIPCSFVSEKVLAGLA